MGPGHCWRVKRDLVIPIHTNHTEISACFFMLVVMMYLLNFPLSSFFSCLITAFVTSFIWQGYLSPFLFFLCFLRFSTLLFRLFMRYFFLSSMSVSKVNFIYSSPFFETTLELPCSDDILTSSFSFFLGYYFYEIFLTLILDPKPFLFIWNMLWAPRINWERWLCVQWSTLDTYLIWSEASPFFLHGSVVLSKPSVQRPSLILARQKHPRLICPRDLKPNNFAVYWESSWESRCSRLM